jgi:hypothetical protein
MNAEYHVEKIKMLYVAYQPKLMTASNPVLYIFCHVNQQAFVPMNTFYTSS